MCTYSVKRCSKRAEAEAGCHELLVGLVVDRVGDVVQDLVAVRVPREEVGDVEQFPRSLGARDRKHESFFAVTATLISLLDFLLAIIRSKTERADVFDFQS